MIVKHWRKDCSGEMFDREITNPTSLPHVFYCDSLHCMLLFHCWHQTDRSRVLSAAPSIAHRPASPTARGNAAGPSLRTLLMNMYNHYKWLTCCFAYVQPLSSEYRLQGPIGAQRCLSKLPSLWSSIYQSRSWSAPRVDRHNELWVLIIFLRGGGEKSVKLGFGSVSTSVKSCWSISLSICL